MSVHLHIGHHQTLKAKRVIPEVGQSIERGTSSACGFSIVASSGDSLPVESFPCKPLKE